LVSAQIAEFLGIPNLMHVSAIEAQKSRVFHVRSQIEHGYMLVEINAPLVLSVAKEINEPRYITLMNILEGEKKEIRVWSSKDLSLSEPWVGLKGSPSQMADLFIPEAKRKVEILQGDPSEMTKTLADRLHRMGYCSAMAMNKTVQSKIWVFAEQRQGELAEVGLELLGKALELAHPAGWKVASVLVSHSLENGLCEQLLSFGADEVLVADHPLLSSYCSQSYAKILEKLIREDNPEVFLLGATAMGSDLGARLAVRLRTGLSAHCVGLELSPENKLLAVVPGWGGNVLARIYSPDTQPQMATVMPGVFDMPQEKKQQDGLFQWMWTSNQRI
jgi:electron transfer flavoprotein alpha/beta subunit